VKKKNSEIKNVFAYANFTWCMCSLRQWIEVCFVQDMFCKIPNEVCVRWQKKKSEYTIQQRSFRELGMDDLEMGL
jgi:hypothetical protein